jgi:hypothetical protein
MRWYTPVLLPVLWRLRKEDFELENSQGYPVSNNQPGYTFNTTTNFLGFFNWAINHQSNWLMLILLSALHRRDFVAVGHIFRKWRNVHFSPKKVSWGMLRTGLMGHCLKVEGGGEWYDEAKIRLNSKASSAHTQSHWRQSDFDRRKYYPVGCGLWINKSLLSIHIGFPSLSSPSYEKCPPGQVPVAHTCNPSCFGGWNQKDLGLRPAGKIVCETPSPK